MHVDQYHSVEYIVLEFQRLDRQLLPTVFYCVMAAIL